jgi:hypothetical protein
MVPANPLPLLVPVTSMSSPAAKVSTASSWRRVGGGVSGADLDQVTTRRRPGLDEVTGLRLAHLAPVDLAEPDLDGVVAVGLGAADLGDHVGARGDHGHRDDLVVLVPELGHAELGAQQALHVAFKSHESDLRA